MKPPQDNVPYGFCHCGCGEKTNLAPKTNKQKGWVAGEPKRFVQYHHFKTTNQRRRPFYGKEYISVSPKLKSRISPEDYERVSEKYWYRHRGGYACSRTGGEIVYLHRFIMRAIGELQIDHINGDPLDNRRDNLRLATPRQNQMNKRTYGSYGYKGIQKANGGWSAFISVEGKRVYLGTFITPEFAARAYDEAAMIHFGKFAMTNEAMGILEPHPNASTAVSDRFLYGRSHSKRGCRS